MNPIQTLEDFYEYYKSTIPIQIREDELSATGYAVREIALEWRCIGAGYSIIRHNKFNTPIEIIKNESV